METTQSKTLPLLAKRLKATSMLNKIKELFTKKLKKPVTTIGNDKVLYDHIIAMARLSLIKPDRLVKESKNIKANAEYLLRMIEESRK